MEVVKSHGCICLAGAAIRRLADEALAFIKDSSPTFDASCASEVQASLAVSGSDAACGSSTSSFRVSSSSTHTLPDANTDSLPETPLILESTLHETRPHVTLVTKEELASSTASRTALLKEFQGLQLTAFFPAGIAMDSKVDALSQHAAAT